MRIADRLLDEGADPSEREKIEFGVEGIVAILVGVSITICVSYLLKEMIRTALLMAFLIPLRQYAGGYHLKSRRTCTVVSVLILFAMIYIMKYANIPRPVALILFVLSSVPIVFWAPVGSVNRQYDMDEKREFGNRAKTVWLLQTVIYFVLWIIDLPKWYIIILLSVIVTSVLVSIGHIQEIFFAGDKTKYV